ncbi:MAG: YidC/Oxa1 family insertase periplasmic-domain containing protein, partial [Deltaproteobacteria bacterium]
QSAAAPTQNVALSTPQAGTSLEKAASPAEALLETFFYKAEFSTLGGTITRLSFLGEKDRRALTQTDFFSGDPRESGIFGVNVLHEKADLAETIFKMTRKGDSVEFSYELPGEYQLTKTFVFRENKPAIDLIVRIKNLSGREKHFPVTLNYGMSYEEGYQKNYGYYDAVAYTDKVQSKDLGHIKKKGFFLPDQTLWAGFIKKYFALLVKPDGKIVEGSARADAKNLWGKSVTEAQWAVREELGDPDVKCAVCGIAGENLVRYANVMTGIKNANGRGGGGCVMGSKKLKLVAARGTMDIKIAHPKEALEFDKRFIEQITSAKVNQTQGALGTPFIWGATNSWGGIRTNNFQYNQLLYADDIEPERLDEISKETVGEHNMAACFGCQVHCRAKYKIPHSALAEKYGVTGKYDEGPEYTSQGGFCSEPGCTKSDTLLICNHLADQLGVDNLEIGSLISWAMELYEEGILTSKDTGGIDLRFGNDEALIDMIQHVCKRDTWLGDLLAEGGIRASEKIGKN